MSFQAEVLNVFIASPSDTLSHRDEIEAAIYQWNKEHAQDFQTILLPRRWETDVAPSHHSKDAQQVINEKLLSNCDLLIGVFWTKLGAPTTDYASGTLEEISIFHAQGKEAMVYFVDEKVHLSVDFSDLQKVNDFKEVFRKKNLAFDYDKNRIVSDLYKKVREHASSRGIDGFNKVSQEQLKVQNASPNLEKILETDELIEAEYIMLSYILQTANRQLGARWMSDATLDQIKSWEAKQFLEPLLSSNYELVLANMAERGLIKEAEHTSYGNPRLYSMPLTTFTELRSLRTDLKEKMNEIIQSKIDPFPF